MQILKAFALIRCTLTALSVMLGAAVLWYFDHNWHTGIKAARLHCAQTFKDQQNTFPDEDFSNLVACIGIGGDEVESFSPSEGSNSLFSCWDWQIFDSEFDEPPCWIHKRQRN